MSTARLAPLLLSALCLSACAAAPGVEAVGRYAAPPPAAAPDADTPLALLPASAGRVVAVRTAVRPNGVSQEIVLDGPRTMSGENRITVEALTTAGDGGHGAAGAELRIGPATDTEITAEMERQLPGVAMHIAAASERDAMGSFGYAQGATGGVTCVYAWQYLAPARPLSLFEGASNTGALPVSIRVRLCRGKPVAALVEDLRRLTLAGPGAATTASLIAPETAPPSDALAAAVGPRMAAESEAAAKAEREPAVAAPRRRLRRTARPSLPLHRRQPRHVARRQAAPQREPLVALPSLPLPGDVSPMTAPARAVAAPSPAPRVAARSAAVEADAMPMPK